MVERLTPDHIKQQLWDGHDGITSAPDLDDYDDALADRGYVIVHADDLRARDEQVVRCALDFCGWHDRNIVPEARNYHYDTILGHRETKPLLGRNGHDSSSNEQEPERS